jgi:D-alanine--poly(phosphoribitol) ligase subunit 1
MHDAIDLFLDVAAANAGKCAVTWAGEQVSYGALERLARQYALLFSAQPEPRVLIALPRGANAYAAILGSGLGGGFYAPANEASPADKLLRVAAELQPNFIVAKPSLAAMLKQAAPGAVSIDPDGVDQGEVLQGKGRRHRIGYIIFTSGSTGVPKGVVIPRTALNHYVAWILASGCVRGDDIVSQYNNLAFDVSIFDIFGAFCAGATLVPIQGRFDRLMPARVIARERISVWTSVPTVVDLMLTAEQLTADNLRSVRLFTLAGEPLLRPQLEAIFAACPDAVVQNAYGPTEATVTVSSMMMTAADFADACDGNAVSIGPAIAHMCLHLAGGPTRDSGEIVIIGPQLAEGYWNNPAKTADVFRPIEIGYEMKCGYFTGDWAERRNGLLYFRQRIDHQVKVRGYRVELDEIAAAMMQCGVSSVCVFKRGDELAALIEHAVPEGFDAAALRGALAARIEAYAIPAQILAVAQLPRNENDKIDRAAAVALFESMIEEAPPA